MLSTLFHSLLLILAQQVAYGAKTSLDDAANVALNFILQHKYSSKTYAGILFVNFSLVIYIIIPVLLQDKL